MTKQELIQVFTVAERLITDKSLLSAFAVDLHSILIFNTVEYWDAWSEVLRASKKGAKQ